MIGVAYILEKNTKFKKIEGSEREYRKELAYADIFEKDGVRFSLGEEDFHMWLSNFEKYTSVGNQVFLQLEHDDDPEATRGEILSLEVSKNEDKKPALYGRIKFRDEEAEDLAKTAQVSVYVVPEAIDGKGNEYKGGLLEHVALTTKPVIPKLEGFTIAASLSLKKGKNTMIKSLAKTLGIEGVGDDTADEVVFSMILSMIEKMKEGTKDEEEDTSEEDTSEEEDDEEDDEEKKKASPMAASLKTRFAKQEVRVRNSRIDNLLSDGRITKKVSDDMKKEFCEPKALSLSFDEEGDGFSDGFDRLADTLQKNDRVLSMSSRTQHQSDSNHQAISATVADAEARAKAAGM